MVAVGDESGEAVALALEGGDPAGGAEAEAGADEGPVQLVDLGFVVFRMLHPSNLPSFHTTRNTISFP